jgi:hypothetical protein
VGHLEVCLRIADVRARTIVLVVAGLVVLGTGLAVAFAASGPSREAHPAATTEWGKCPTGITGATVRYATVDQVIAAARRVVIDHKVVFVQGRRVRLNARNTAVVEVVALGSYPTLLGQRPLKREAAKRCGVAAARWAWAVVFSPAWSVICCQYWDAFVVRTEDGWHVF